MITSLTASSVVNSVPVPATFGLAVLVAMVPVRVVDQVEPTSQLPVARLVEVAAAAAVTIAMNDTAAQAAAASTFMDAIIVAMCAPRTDDA
jgi:hypothetical protein